jgi:uncharacterized repeat protein (TIGR01451 family)
MKLKALLSIAMMAVVAFALTGCEDDAALWPCGQTDDSQTAAADRDTRQSDQDRMESGEQDYASVDQPKWKSDSQRGWASMALPTGRRDSSVLLIEKIGPRKVRAGKPFTYKIRVTNLTDLALSNVQVTEEIPDNFNVESIDPEARKKGADRIWSWKTMPAHASRTIEITGVMPKTGTITSCTDATWQHNALCLDFAAVKPELELMLSGPDQTLVCDPLVYTVTIRNTGDAPATNIRMSSDFPENLKSIDGRDSLDHRISRLEPGQEQKLRIRAKAGRADTYKHMVSLQADGEISKESDTVTTDVRTPVLVVKAKAPEKRYVGRPIDYEISIRNTGNAPSTNTVLRQDLPSGVEFISASDNGTHKNGTVTWNIGTLGIDKRKDMTVKVRASKMGDLDTEINATAYCAGGDASDRTDTATTAIKGIPAVLLEMVDRADPVEIGAAETYEIRVTNQGSIADTNVVITAELPDEFKFVSADGPTDAKRNGNKITFEPLDSLAPKEKVVYTVTAKAQSTGDVRFRVTLKTDQTTKPVMENESTHIYE